MSDDCLFCKMVAGKIPTTKIFENENVLGFVDIYPQAKLHFLFIHKTHSRNFNELMQSPEDAAQILKAIQEFTLKEKLHETGFRIVTNTGVDAGQTVFHTHFHLLAGEKLAGFGARK